jgi:hypothetical protein
MRTSRKLLFTVASLLLAMAAAAWVAAQSDIGNQNEHGADRRQFFPVILRNMGPLDEEMERDALVALYQSTNGAGWENNAGWLGPGTPCMWHGVTCVNGRVTILFLPYNQLNGPIPEELSNLTGLDWLNLFDNQLSGPIPKELGNLGSLRWLYLSANKLTGPIPRELGNLSNLQGLRLASNQLIGGIPNELSNLDNLWALDLRDNQLSCWESTEGLQWALGFGCGKYPWDFVACFDYPTPGETICP